MSAMDDKAAYLKAQKQRNLVIGLGLVAFVVLVFFISMARMSAGLHKDAEKRAAGQASIAAATSANTSQ